MNCTVYAVIVRHLAKLINGFVEKLTGGQRSVSNLKYPISPSGLLQLLRRGLHGIDDMLVASAPSEVAGDGQADFSFAEIRILFEPGFGRHQGVACLENSSSIRSCRKTLMID